MISLTPSHLVGFLIVFTLVIYISHFIPQNRRNTKYKLKQKLSNVQ